MTRDDETVMALANEMTEAEAQEMALEYVVKKLNVDRSKLQLGRTEQVANQWVVEVGYLDEKGVVGIVESVRIDKYERKILD